MTTTATKPPTDTALPKGMTLRDWFAGQALTGLAAEGRCIDSRELASVAYEIADAMIAARRNGK